MKVVAAVFLVLLSLAPPAISQVPDDKLIVPGQRIGKWTLEMTIDDLSRTNGQVGIVERGGATDFVSGDFWWHHWYTLGFHAITMGRDSQRVLVLDVTTREYKTARGIAANSSPRGDLEGAYGRPTVVTQPQPAWSSPIYDELGFGVDFNPNGVAQSIFIFRPGSAKQIFRF